jgi:hypothetical protein
VKKSLRISKMVLSIRSFSIDLWPHDATCILVTIDQALFMKYA